MLETIQLVTHLGGTVEGKTLPTYPPFECSTYDSKQFDDKVPVLVEL